MVVAVTYPQSARQVPCEKCPLGKIHGFRKFTSEELEFVSGFKTGELTAEAGTTVLSEGNHSEHLYTVISGWGFRHKLLENGRRQILNFVLPGDLVGLQGSWSEQMGHSVEALSNMLLCVFERSRLWELYRGYPGLGYDLTWLAAREERISTNICSASASGPPSSGPPTCSCSFLHGPSFAA